MVKSIKILGLLFLHNINLTDGLLINYELSHLFSNNLKLAKVSLSALSLLFNIFDSEEFLRWVPSVESFLSCQDLKYKWTSSRTVSFQAYLLGEILPFDFQVSFILMFFELDFVFIFIEWAFLDIIFIEKFSILLIFLISIAIFSISIFSTSIIFIISISIFITTSLFAASIITISFFTSLASYATITRFSSHLNNPSLAYLISYSLCSQPFLQCFEFR